ncbi:Rho GTPase-activating protein 32 [Toxocara canis]|uniref:Rho GTPase-activating protein 32 n=1 Tax=Toxocara canis TaxID=6265 RepID=A0A0B2VBQ7_TOXCA|nr:Rho GTPase-activating protein 32 [Toxocara canis]
MDSKDLEGLRHIRICRRPPAQLPQPGAQIRLECVGSYNLDLEIGDRRGFSTYTLREVPIFLVDAFKLLRLHGMAVEGIFRKEGNINRIKNVWPTYFGCKDIPEQCNTHDICTMIKRFFRELKTPLLVSQQTELLQVAVQFDGRERVEKLLEAVRQLPPGQLGTFSFLMRQLKYFGENHEKGHHMTAENLALVFAPTLFRDDFPASAVKKKKGSQENLISSACSDNELKVAILVDLIDNAQKIGVPRDYYIASRRPSDVLDKSRSYKISFSGHLVGVPPRSSSARPSPRHHAFVVNDDIPKVKPPVKGSSLKNDEEAKASQLRRGRRSSSTVREIFTTISNKVLRRGLSPGGLPRRASEDSEGGTEMTDTGFTSDPGSKKKYKVGNLFCGAKKLFNNRSNYTSLQKAPVAKSSTDGVSRVYVDEEEIVDGRSALRFKRSEDEAAHGGITKVLSFENIEAENATSTPNATPVKIRQHASGLKKSSSRRNSDDDSMVTTQRRSRRESPRKHLTVNSKVKPVSPVRGGASSWVTASPADEPSEMNTKQISSASVRRRESDEKKTISGKVVKRNSSKGSKCSSVSSPKAIDPSISLLDDCGVSQPGRVGDQRRRHTTPVRPSALRRNQPNTLTTGLKAAQVHIRASVRRRESDEKKTISGKVVKRNSSKGSKCSSVSSPKAIDPSISLLDDCGVSQPGRVGDQRRRHTTPVRPSALRRNQPNTLTTGLKAAQVHIRDRRSTTSFGSRIEENGSLRRGDKKKRGSSGALSCSEGSRQNSDEENDTVVLSPVVDANAILQQKGLESRERRAKRHKRREESASSKRPERLLSREMISSNLLDDVTNELERLERGRGDAASGGAMSSLTLLANGYPSPFAHSPSKTVTTSAYASGRVHTASSVKGNGTAVAVSYSSTESSSLMTSSSVCASPASTQASSASDSQKLKRRSSMENSRRSPSKKPPSCGSTTHRRNTTAITAPTASYDIASSPWRSNTDAVPYKVKSISVEGDSMRICRKARLIGQQHAVDESEFAQSDDIKKQIINASNNRDIKSGPAHIAFDARPSVAYIQQNNRGIVRQRVNQFAQLGGTSASDETAKMTTRLSAPMQERYCFDEFVKPAAPPASHGLRHAERRRAPSPTCSVSVSARARKFEALAKAASERAARKGIPKGGNLAAKLSRRAIGERREARVTRHLLSKSLGKLELLASCKSSGRASLGCLSDMTAGVHFIHASSQQSGVHAKEVKLNRRRLKYVNPILRTRTRDLCAVSESQPNV